MHVHCPATRTALDSTRSHPAAPHQTVSVPCSAPSNVTEYVRDANSLDRFRISSLYAPMGTDMLLGATRQRQLVIWQYNKMAAYRWVQYSWLYGMGGCGRERGAGSWQWAAGREWCGPGLDGPGFDVCWLHSRPCSCKTAPTAMLKPRFRSMFRKHEDWVEALAVVSSTLGDGTPCDEVFSAGADGRVLRWQLDVEENCDIYECIVSFSFSCFPSGCCALITLGF